MKRASLLFLFCLGVIETMYSQTQNEFVLTPDQPASNTNIRITDCKENGHPLATVVFYTAIDSVEFETVGNNRIRNQKYEEKLGCYVLCLDGKDEKWRYIQIDIRKKGYRTYQMEAIQIENGDYMAYKLSPMYDDTPKNENIAQITIYGKDGKPLEGAKLTDMRTGKSELTNSEGAGRIKLEREGLAIKIKVSHPSYSDIINTTVRAGDNQEYALLNYNPVKPSEISTVKPQKPYNHNNTLAFFESAVLPGLGQWGKGYVGHGILNMVGEAALVGGTVYFYNSAKKYSSEVSDGPVNAEIVDIYNRNVTAYKVLLGAAITLYVFNLFQAVLLEPKKSEYVLAPTLMPVNNSLALGVEMTFNF